MAQSPSRPRWADMRDTDDEADEARPPTKKVCAGTRVESWNQPQPCHFVPPMEPVPVFMPAFCLAMPVMVVGNAGGFSQIGNTNILASTGGDLHGTLAADWQNIGHDAKRRRFEFAHIVQDFWRAGSSVSGKLSINDEEEQGEGEDVEAVWQRRSEKRRAAIAIVKGSMEYKALAERGKLQRIRSKRSSRLRHAHTPDPADRSISKRRWEEEVRLWRVALRTRCKDNSVDKRWS